MRLGRFFTYYGSKRRLAPCYPKPTYNTIIEPFAGAAGYSTEYYQKSVILYDLNPIVCGIWDYLIKSTPSEIMSLPGFFDHIDDIKVSQEAKWFLGFWLGTAVVSPALTPYKWSRELSDKRACHWGVETRFRIANQVNFIKHWKIFNEPYHKAENREATWFIDPPYNNKAGKNYLFKMNDYRHLANWCQNRKGQVIVCENVGANWLDFKPFAAIQTNFGRNRKKFSAEAIWTNDFGTIVPTLEQGSSDEVRYVGPPKLVSADGKPIDPAICQV